jgi:hypothetical protein
VAEHDLDFALGVGAVACFVFAPEATPACAYLAFAALGTGVTASAAESGLIGDRPTNYCRFALSTGASVVLYGSGTAISRLWAEPYVLSEIDRKILRGSTEFIGADLDVLAGAGASGICTGPAHMDIGTHAGK